MQLGVLPEPTCINLIHEQQRVKQAETGKIQLF